MIHPNTELKFVSDHKGHGIFATSAIPAGTIVYILDDLEIFLSPEDALLKNDKYRSIIDTFTYRDENGQYILSWDHAKYVNHCCFPNTLSTGYGFEIAIRNILPGEEITDEYGLFNPEQQVAVNCGKANCRRWVKPKDIDQYYHQWDDQVRQALAHYHQVTQPLEVFMDDETQNDLIHYLSTGDHYKSVRSLKFARDQIKLRPG